MWHDVLVGDNYSHIYSGYHAAFNEDIRISVFKVDKKAKQIFSYHHFFFSNLNRTSSICNWWQLYLKNMYPHNSASLPAPSPANFLSMRIIGVDGIKRFRLPFHFFSSVTFDHFTACFLIDPCHHALALRLTWLLCLHSSFKLETIFAVAATSTCSLSFPTLSSLCPCGCCLSGLSGEVIKWFCSLL